MGLGRGRDQGPLEFENWHFPIPFLAKKVVFLVSSGWKEISPLLVPSWKIFLANLWKNPQLAYPGKNPSDAHVTATGTIMRFVGSNSQVYYHDWHNRLFADFPSKVLLFNEALPWSLTKPQIMVQCKERCGYHNGCVLA